jgi:hypothetical protein
MRALQVSLRAVLGVAALAPWLWLALFAWLSVAATLHLGRLPRNPDPKHLVEVAWLYGMTSWLLVPIGLTPIAVSACLAIRSFVNPDIRDARWMLVVHGLGYALAAAIMFSNVLGLSHWFLD